MPRTLEELFDLYEIPKQLERPCKCGIELRSTDERNYGGYFYNWGKAAGLECYEVVRDAVPKEINVILKCACTEFELKNGPVEDYVASEGQIEVENLIDKNLVLSDINWRQPDFLLAYVMLSWIHRAMKIGDQTYKIFTNGKKLVPTLRTYHEEIENG